jgi:hypothetical protein
MRSLYHLEVHSHKISLVVVHALACIECGEANSKLVPLNDALARQPPQFFQNHAIALATLKMYYLVVQYDLCPIL